MSVCSIKQVTLPQGVQMLNEPELLHTVFKLRLTGPVYVHIFIDVDAVTWVWAAAVDKIRTYIHTVCSHK